jgi:hypothetical protein
MKKNDFLNKVYAAHKAGTFITTKHDPRRIRLQTFNSYRTVVSDELADRDNIMDALHDSRTRIQVYFDCDVKHSSMVYVTAEPICVSSVAASGIASGAIVPCDTMDYLALIDGSAQGWHVFGEHSVKIADKVQDSLLIKIDEF